MSENINWGMIKSGAQFESLIHSILFFEYPDNIQLFGRPGKDSGIDAKNKDNSIIYQAKFHQNCTIDNAISDAKNELEKIKKYREERHDNYKYWETVKQWILYTNVLLNPNDERRWKEEIVSLFSKHGLIAALKSLEDINALLIKYPDIVNHYFEGKNRIFLSMTEAREIVNNDYFFNISADIPRVGWNDEIEKVINFLNDNTSRILPVIGMSGIGKTKFLYESALETINRKESWICYWSLTNEMNVSNEWFKNIPQGYNILLLIDEPNSLDLIERIAQQAQTLGSKNWKIIITTRTAKINIIQYFKNKYKNIVYEQIELPQLSKEDAEKFIDSLLTIKSISIPNKNRLINFFIHYSFKTPIWLVLSIWVYNKYGDLREIFEDTSFLIEKYLDEVLNEFDDKNQIKQILNWVALYNNLNIENENTINYIIEQIDISVSTFEDALNKLIEKKAFLINKGVRNRIYEIKPDIIRDYLLKQYFFSNDGKSQTLSGEKFIINLLNTPPPELEKIFNTLSFIDFTYNEKKETLLYPIFVFLDNEVSAGDLNIINSIVRILSLVSKNNISKSIYIFNKIINNKIEVPYKVKSIWGEIEITHVRVVDEIPWILFTTAPYANDNIERKMIINLMKELILYQDTNSDKKYLESTGKGAKQLFQRIIYEEYFSYLYFDCVKELVDQYFEILRKNLDINSINCEIFKIIILNFVRLERLIFEYDAFKIKYTKFITPYNGNIWKERKRVIQEIIKIIKDKEANTNNRLLSITILCDLHRDANFSISHFKIDNDYKNNIINELKNNLSFSYELLTNYELSLAEKSTLKEIWDWHFQFEAENDELKKLAIKCNDKYLADSKIKQMNIIFDSYDRNDINYKIEIDNLIKTILDSNEIETLYKLIHDVNMFTKRNSYQLSSIANMLSNYLNDYHFLNDFIIQEISKYNLEKESYKFALDLMKGYIIKLRENNNIVESIKYQEKIIKCTNQKDLLLYSLYNDPRPFSVGIVSKEELQFIIIQLNMIHFSEINNKLWVLGGLSYVDWDIVIIEIDKVWNELEVSKKTSAFINFFDSFYLAYQFKNDLNFKLDKKKLLWIFNKVTEIPNLDDIEGYSHDFEKLFKDSEKFNLEWLKDFIIKREKYEEDFKGDKEIKFRGIPYFNDISKWIDINFDSNDLLLLDEILNLNSNKNLTGYYLPKLIKKLDPSGDHISSLIVKKIEGSGIKDLILWSRFAGSYKKNSKSWREITTASLKKLNENLGFIEKEKIYYSFYPEISGTWTGEVGKIASHFYNQIKEAEDNLHKETESLLIDFWQFDLKKANEEFEREKGSIEESGDIIDE